MPLTPEEFAARTAVSRKTLAQLTAYARLLAEWNSLHNLVAASTAPDLWERHMLDCAQLAPLVPPDAGTLADLGSGAGFPGLVLAALLPQLAVTLHEATSKKCAFLQAAADCMEIQVTIRNARMEELAPQPYDVVTARACAPLPRLLGYAYPFTGPNTVCLFLKGQNVGPELTEAHKCWNMKVSQIASQTDPLAAIVMVRELSPRHVESRESHPRPAKGAGRRQPKGRRR